MADYWKSNPRHFCEFCKCWIADNKPSRDFHERGKNHQANVKKRLSEVTKNSVAKEKKEQEEMSFMEAMEAGAKRAFVKDIMHHPELANQYGVKLKKSSDKEEKGKAGESSGSVQADEEQVKGTWKLASSPEGYPYYWNDISGAVQWEKPADFDSEEKGGENDGESDEVRTEETADDPGCAAREANQSDGDDSSSEGSGEVSLEDQAVAQEEAANKTIPTHEIPLPVSHIPLPGDPDLNPTKTAPEEEVDEVDDVKPVGGQKRPHTMAYGSWESVPEPTDEPPIDLGLPAFEKKEVQTVTVCEEPKFKFREKKVDSLGAGLAEFKKRKLAAKNLKQRTTNDN